MSSWFRARAASTSATAATTTTVEWERCTVCVATNSRATCKKCRHPINTSEIKVEIRQKQKGKQYSEAYSTHWDCWHMPARRVTPREKRIAFSGDAMVIIEAENIPTNILIEIHAFLADAKPLETVQDFLWRSDKSKAEED